MEVGRVLPAVEAFRWVVVVDYVDVYAAAADFQRGFEGFQDAAAFCGNLREAVLDDCEGFRERATASFLDAPFRALFCACFLAGATRREGRRELPSPSLLPLPLACLRRHPHRLRPPTSPARRPLLTAFPEGSKNLV